MRGNDARFFDTHILVYRVNADAVEKKQVIDGLRIENPFV
jgi:predicted nucleic acid-binding protein